MSDSSLTLTTAEKGKRSIARTRTRALKCKWTARSSSYTLVSVFMHERRIGIGGGRASSCSSHVRLGKAPAFIAQTRGAAGCSMHENAPSSF